MIFPSTIAEKCTYMLEQHGLMNVDTEGGYRVFENVISPDLGKYIYIGPKGSVRVGDNINTALASPIMRERLLREFRAHVNKAGINRL